jgi:hypothetical protein
VFLICPGEFGYNRFATGGQPKGAPRQIFRILKEQCTPEPLVQSNCQVTWLKARVGSVNRSMNMFHSTIFLQLQQIFNKLFFFPGCDPELKR